MPFGARVVATRPDIPEIYQGNTHNVLEKASVSNMIGLLQQMNEISKYASEIFSSLLQEADKSIERINNCKQRINKIDQNVPHIENMFIQNSPAYFYDNPYSGREYSRRDNLRGLFFRRDRAAIEVNRRRVQAEPPPDFSSMDAYNENKVPCIKKYTDATFFMNQWLEAEKQKMEEDRKRRKQRKDARKNKKQLKRVTTKVIMKVDKKKFNALGAEFQTEAKSDEPQYAEVKQYALDNETPGGDDDEKSPRMEQVNKQGINHKMNNKNDDVDADDEEDEIKEGKDKNKENDIDFDKDAQDEDNPPGLFNQRSNEDDNDNIFVPKNQPPPPPPPGPNNNNNNMMNNMNNINMNNNNNNNSNNPYQEESNIYFPEPVEARPIIPQRPKPALPSRGANFLDAIQKGVTLSKTEPVKRETPQDSRSQLLTSISKGKQLKHVEKEEAPKPKEEGANASIYAVLQRRKFIEDSESDDSEGSDWGSEED